MTEFRISREKLKVTVDKYGCSLEEKCDLIRRIGGDKEMGMRREISAFKLQLEEYK